MAVHESPDDLPHSIHRDARSLFDRQGVIRRFQFDQRLLAERASVNLRLQKKRLGIKRQRSAEPAEERRFVLSARGFPDFNCPTEALLAERGPHAPHEGTRPIDNWKLQATPNEELALVDDANVGIQCAPSLAFFLSYGVVGRGSI